MAKRLSSAQPSVATLSLEADQISSSSTTSNLFCSCGYQAKPGQKLCADCASDIAMKNLSRKELKALRKQTALSEARGKEGFQADACDVGKLRPWKDMLENIAKGKTTAADEIPEIPFLAGLPPAVIKKLSDHMGTFLRQFSIGDKDRSIDDMAKDVTDYYDRVKEYLDDDNYYKNTTSDWKEKILNEIERYIIAKLYPLVFATDQGLYQRNLSFEERVRTLQWLSPQSLDAVYDQNNEEGRRYFCLAQEQLIIMDTKESPQDKLECVVRCSRYVFDTIGACCPKNAKAADDFLPVLIYVVLQTNAPFLLLNVEFIQKFCNPKRLWAGEGAFYFTSLSAAVNFLENVTAAQLKIPETEFHLNSLGLLSPKYFPETPNQKRIEEQLERLKKLELRQQEVQRDLLSLSEVIESLCSSAVHPLPVFLDSFPSEE